VNDTVSGLVGNSMAGISSAKGSGLLGFGSQAQDIGAMQATTSVLGGMASLYSGAEKASGYQTQASEYRTRAAGEGVEAQGQTLGLKNQYLQAVGSQDARLAAGGYDLGQGVAQDNRTTMAQSAVNSEQEATLAGKVRASQDMANASMADAAAAEAKGAGGIGALGGIFGAGLNLLKFGVI
jgi:hypothetical protein